MRLPVIVIALMATQLACRAATVGSAPGTAAPAAVGATPPQAEGRASIPDGTARQAPASAAPVSAQASAPKPVPAVLPEVLARVNGEPIRKAEFELAIRRLEAQAGQGVPFERRDEVYRNLLDQLIGLHLLVQEAAARKLTPSDAEVEAQLAEVRKRFPSEEAFAKVLAEQHLTLDGMRQDARTQLSVSKILQTVVGPTISVSEQDVRGFYDGNPDRFKEPEAVRASHILIRVPDKADEATRTAARARAEMVLKLVQGGGDFAALAREYSQDAGSAANGGDLGFVIRGRTIPAFETAVFALQAGQTSGVVETPVGFHVIRVSERRAPRVVPFEEAAGQIRQFLTEQQKQQKAEAFVQQLKGKARIDILM